MAGGGEKKNRPKIGATIRGAPKGIRTPVAGLKGLSPGPLDDGGLEHEYGRSIAVAPETVKLEGFSYALLGVIMIEVCLSTIPLGWTQPRR